MSMQTFARHMSGCRFKFKCVQADAVIQLPIPVSGIRYVDQQAYVGRQALLSHARVCV